MFDYLRNNSSNAHQVRCEDSPTKAKVCMAIACPVTLTFIQGHKFVSWPDGRLMDTIMICSYTSG